MAKKFYAIRKGFKTGVFFEEWDIVKKYVQNYKGAEFKGFNDRISAESYLNFTMNKTINNNNDLTIYTDGSFTPNDEGFFSSGAVVLKDNQIIHEISTHYVDLDFASFRNISGEVMAIVESLKWCNTNNICSITFYVDYQGLISWYEGKWIAKTNISKFFLKALEVYKNIKIDFVKVGAHTNDFWNDYADALAKKGKVRSKIDYN